MWGNEPKPRDAHIVAGGPTTVVDYPIVTITVSVFLAKLNENGSKRVIQSLPFLVVLALIYRISTSFGDWLCDHHGVPNSDAIAPLYIRAHTLKRYTQLFITDLFV